MHTHVHVWAFPSFQVSQKTNLVCLRASLKKYICINTVGNMMCTLLMYEYNIFLFPPLFIFLCSDCSLSFSHGLLSYLFP